ncbi:MAG: FkbM family methyltransferase [Desulfomonilaceae bacterium]|nr:FkbM family methyltransferase [Desulfomonilaceae bacterium]
MMERTWSDRLAAAYAKVFPWRLRYKFGSPFVSSLMKLKGNKVTIRDFDVFLDPDDKTATELFLVHACAGDWIWESYEIALFLECLKAHPHSLAVDVGANYGAYSLSCCPLVRDGVVKSLIAVEPNRSTFACLKKSVEFNGFSPYVHLVHAAASRTHDTECVFHPHETFSAMSKVTTEPWSQRLSGHGAGYKVRGIALDGLLPELGCAGIGSSIAKIDVEGAEPEVFHGMEATLNNARGYQVFFELHPGALLSLGNDPLEFGNFLFGLGVDVMAEVDQHEKVTRRIRSLREFATIVEGCLATKEMWRDYKNIFISKGLRVPIDIRG